MEISRRELFKGLGAAAGVAAVALTEPVLADEDHPTEAPPEEPGSKRLRRWAMVIDLRRCDGCAGLGVPPQCTQFCNWGRLVPDGQEWAEVYRTKAGDLPGEGEGFPQHAEVFFPAICMQCENAPCTNVCPVAATFHAPEGVVLIDQERCIGCRLCIAACPYDRRFFNWGEPAQPGWVRTAPYNVLSQTPAIRGTVMKCDLCTDRAAAGGLPMCVEGCPRGALYFGDLEEDVATNGTDLVRLSHYLEENNAFRYKEELGTSPRVWYIPGHGEDATVEVDVPRFRRDHLEWIGRQMVEWEKEHPIPPTSPNGGSGHD